jgi:hypothetical protein
MNSPLVNYALAGLRRCWLPETGSWSHIYHLDNRAKPNESVPHSDVFYTLNVLLGMARVPSVPADINIPAIFDRNISRLTTLPVSRYALGVALWSAAELKLAIPNGILRFVQEVCADRNEWKRFTAQDLGMILIGVVAQARHDPKRWSGLASELFEFMVRGYCSESGLFFEGAGGLRRRFSSFATQTYLTLASYIYGEFAESGASLEIADACTRRLISLQGPNGEWPWFLDSVTGRVLDFYEVYVVHQYGMAPAFLEYAERRDLPGARDALLRGFNWIFGQNQLEVQMLVPELTLSIRSQVRKGELDTRKLRMLRAIRVAVLGENAHLADRSDLELRLECRSYELGWLLWSFARRADVPELTHHEIFAAATSHDQAGCANSSLARIQM